MSLNPPRLFLYKPTPGDFSCKPRLYNNILPWDSIRHAHLERLKHSTILHLFRCKNMENSQYFYIGI